jgi:uncharacterized protein YceK
MTTRRTLLALTLTVALAPGCIIGSPSAAISGEPYGWTVEDWRGLTGDRRSAWRDHSVLAAIDLPFAAVLDTAFLPISLIIWGLSAAFGGGDEGEAHDHGDGMHTHDDDDEGHTHAPAGELHSHGEGYQHTHEDGATPHSHASD